MAAAAIPLSETAEEEDTTTEALLGADLSGKNGGDNHCEECDELTTLQLIVKYAPRERYFPY
jgi:hypothetical protein